MTMATNLARFTINGTPSEDADGVRGFDAIAGQDLAITLEKNPALSVLTVTYDLYDATKNTGPLNSLFDTSQVFVQNGQKSITLSAPNSTVNVVINPATDISSYSLRATVVTAQGAQIFERIIAVRKEGLRMIVPAESTQYAPRGWSDAINELTKLMAGGAGRKWRTLIDLDFQDLSPQTIDTDGEVELGGITWVKQGSAVEKLGALINVYGLRFYPKNNTYTGHTSESGFPDLVGVSTSLAGYGIPDASTPIRVLVRMAAFNHSVPLYSIFGPVHMFSPISAGAPAGMIGDINLDRPDMTRVKSAVWRGVNVWGVNYVDTTDEYIGSPEWDVYGVEAPAGVLGATSKALTSAAAGGWYPPAGVPTVVSGWPADSDLLVGDNIRIDETKFANDDLDTEQMISRGTISENWRLYLLSASGYTGGSTPYVQYRAVRVQAFF